MKFFRQGLSPQFIQIFYKQNTFVELTSCVKTMYILYIFICSYKSFILRPTVLKFGVNSTYAHVAHARVCTRNLTKTIKDGDV